MNLHLSPQELAISIASSLRDNPINPDTPQSIRKKQLELIADLTDQLAANPMVAQVIWNLIPGDLQQVMLLAGFANIGGFIEQQIEFANRAATAEQPAAGPN